jgi:geranylgeranyl pyrophosphate synthase
MQPAGAIARTGVVVWRSAAQKRRYNRGLERVEKLLEAVVTGCPGTLGSACGATLAAGGKRVRPLLVLLSARRDRPFTPDAHRAAAAVELLHMATLVHDDVLDGAVLRRGRPTIAQHLGVPIAVSAGNYMFAQAFALLVATSDGRAVDLLSRVAEGLSRGEVLQMEEAYRVDLAVADYAHRCELKTADLFAAACSLGAIVSGAAEDDIAGLAAYGRSLGLAFQIFDDILDLTGDEAQIGKRLGTDLRDGTVTLPVIMALQARPDLGVRLQRPLGPTAAADPGSDVGPIAAADAGTEVADTAADAAVTAADTEVTALIADIAASGAIEKTRVAALEQIAEAREHLALCSELVERELLGEVAGWVVERFS